MIFNAAIFALLFAYRGSGAQKWVYLVGSAIIIAITHQDWLIWAAYMWIATVMGCFATKPLLDLTHKGARFGQAIKTGFIRSLPIIPSIMYLQNPWICVLFLHGVIYWAVGKYIPDKHSHNATRVSEYLTGGMIGGVL